jgi:hypothetical protein
VAQLISIKGTVNNITPAEIYYDKTVSGATHAAATGYATDRGFFTWVNGADRLNISTSGNVGIGTTTPTANLDVHGTMAIMGTVTNGLSWNVTYGPATTDGIVTGAGYETDSNSCVIHVVGYSDSGSNPTTIRSASTYKFTPATIVSGWISINMPVRKGDYWKTVWSNTGTCAGEANGTLNFTPFGR